MTAVNYTAYRIERRPPSVSISQRRCKFSIPLDSLINERQPTAISRAQRNLSSSANVPKEKLERNERERKKEEKKVSRALNNFHSDKTHAHLGYESTLADYKVRAVDKVARHHDARPRLMIIIKKRLNVTICTSGRTRNSIVVIKG